MPETIQKLNQAHLYALQSQMNPHFLYNTLENIKSLSIQKYGLDNEIEQSLILLDKIIFESINQKNVLSSIRDEIETTKSYIALMKLRFGDTFSVKWDIDSPDTLSASIIRFTLQPIIENSILKGFDRYNTNYYIRISIHCIENDIQITVQDNGCGISPAKLAKIKADLENTEDYPTKHIGLKNLNFRIQLLFGKTYGITEIKSDKSGTKVSLIIPKHIFYPPSLNG